MTNDTISDALARIKNAITRGRAELTLPYSNVVMEVFGVLKENGYINELEIIDNPAKRADSKSDNKGYTKLIRTSIFSQEKPGEKIIREVVRVSKPGKRVYRKKSDLRPVLEGYGIAIISTPKGIMSDKDARKQNTGGEVLCNIY